MHTNIHPDHLLAAHRIEAAAHHRLAERRRLLGALRRATRRTPAPRDGGGRDVPATGRPAVAA